MSRSVFDFLYQDVARVGALLSQFNPNGLLTSLTHTETATSGAENTAKVGGGLSVLAAKGTLAEEDKFSESSSGSAARAFDPRWANSLALLQHLQNEGMLNRNVAHARLGQIVMTSGALEIFDIPLLKSMFSSMSLVQQFIEKGGGKKPTAAEVKQQKALFNMVTALPLSVQLLLTCDDKKIWSVLDEACLQTSATNLFLKYGSKIFGTWSMLGILDAIPDPAGPVAESDEDVEMETAMTLMRHFESMHRLLGRPPGAYSVTPLLIFREVSAAGATSAI